MRLKTFAILSAVTAVVVVGAIVEQSGTASATRVAGGEKLFPDLATELNGVARIEVAEHDKSFTVLRNGDQWTLRERGGYRVDPDVVKRVLSAFVEMQTVEAKTDKPASYPRIQVEDVAAKDAKSLQVTIKNTGGKDMARLIVGKPRESKTGAAADRLYVRRAGEAQSWLVKSTLSVDKDPVRWLDRKMVDVASERVSRVTTVQPDGARLVIVKDKPGSDGKFALQGTVPAGMKPKSQGDLGAPASALTALEFDDVKPVGEIDFGKKPVGEADYRTFDGLVISIKMAEVDGNVWGLVTASVDESARPAQTDSAKSEPAKPGDDKAGDKKPGEDKAAAEKKAPAIKSLDEVKKEAAAITARVQGWAYKLPSFAVRSFQSKMADMVEKEKSS
ncbi:MAG TPA: DUF4340 domain-containing protein [Alphaproteobacteria bacterium]|nr:DUF4340 domain-containing protein [Alphaproteobacteria bacterium]